MRNRKLGAKLFPKIADVILDEDNCYPEIFEAFSEHHSLDDLPAEIPSEWAYCWARDIGDHAIMRDRVTDSQWAFYWARRIGDHAIMRDRVTESKWAYCWARHIGDREIMRDRVTDSEWAYRWAHYIGPHLLATDKTTQG